MYTWSENPTNEIWKQLKLLSYKENCKNLLIGVIKSGRTSKYAMNDPTVEKKSLEISMLIQQGIEYFDASNRVTINTSPLLIYYGMLSLAKALIVANSEANIDDIKYHGLSTRPISQELEEFRRNKNLCTIEKEYAVVNNGVFCELNKVICPNAIIPNNSIIRIKDCLFSVPELKDYYEKYYQEPSGAFGMYVRLAPNRDNVERLEFALNNEEDCVNLIRLVPTILNDFDRKENMHSIAPYFLSKKNMNINAIRYLENYESCIGGRYLVVGIPYEYNNQIYSIVVEQALIDYVVMFILGEQVRYHQDLWCNLVKGYNSGTLGLIEVYIDIIKRRYPNYVLNYLFNEEFEYGVPARLG